jgi:hypothetical protein
MMQHQQNMMILYQQRKQNELMDRQKQEQQQQQTTQKQSGPSLLQQQEQQRYWDQQQLLYQQQQQQLMNVLQNESMQFMQRQQRVAAHWEARKQMMMPPKTDRSVKVKKIDLVLAVAVTVENFKDSVRTAFLEGLATALLVNVEDIVIVSVTSKSTGRRLLQSAGVDVETAITVAESASVSVIADINLDNIAFAMADAGIETLEIEPPVISEVEPPVIPRNITAAEQRLVGNLGMCPCVNSM